jgi:hypothetical protein
MFLDRELRRGRGMLKPSLARSFVTLLLPTLVTQMLAPSNATPLGLEATAKQSPLEENISNLLKTKP